MDEGLRLLRSQRFDLLLLDHTLPSGSSLDELRLLRAEHPQDVMHTGYLSPEDEENALCEGVREVVLKLCIMLCHVESTTASGDGFQRLARDQFAQLGTMPLPSPIKRAPDLPALEECRCPSFTLPALLLSG